VYRWSDPEVDRLLRSSDREVDEDARVAQLGRIQEILLLRMLLDVRHEEGADRDDFEATLAGGRERGSNQQAADPSSLVSRRHLRVGEYDLARAQSIFGDGERAVAKVDLKAVFFPIVADGVGRGVGHALTVASSAIWRTRALATC